MSKPPCIYKPISVNNQKSLVMYSGLETAQRSAAVETVEIASDQKAAASNVANVATSREIAVEVEVVVEADLEAVTAPEATPPHMIDATDVVATVTVAPPVDITEEATAEACQMKAVVTAVVATKDVVLTEAEAHVVTRADLPPITAEALAQVATAVRQVVHPRTEEAPLALIAPTALVMIQEALAAREDQDLEVTRPRVDHQDAAVPQL